MPYIIKWLSDNHSAILPIIIATYWVLSALKGVMTPARPPVQTPPRVVDETPTLAGPAPQRLPYQPLGGAPTPNAAQAGRTPVLAPIESQSQTFAEQAVTRLEQRFASSSGAPTKSAKTLSSQSMDKLRAESDRQFTSDAATSTAQQIVADATAAAKVANRPGLVEQLGYGDTRKGSLVAAIALSQALERRRAWPRGMGISGNKPSVLE